MVVGDNSGRLIVSRDNVLTWEVIEGKSGGGGGGLDGLSGPENGDGGGGRGGIHGAGTTPEVSSAAVGHRLPHHDKVERIQVGCLIGRRRGQHAHQQQYLLHMLQHLHEDRGTRLEWSPSDLGTEEGTKEGKRLFGCAQK